MTTTEGGRRFPDRDVGTLAQSRRARNLRRIGLALLALLVAAALAGQLGPRERTTVVRTDDGLAVEATHPTVVRPGMEIDVVLAVTAPGGPDAVTVEIDQDVFERAGIELAVPEPDRQEARAGRVRMTFAVADGEEDVTLLLTGRLPTRADMGPITVGIDVGRSDDPAAVAPLGFRMWVLP